MHTVFCPNCGEKCSNNIVEAAYFNCEYCHQRYLDLGPLPIPNWDLESSSKLDNKLKYTNLREVTLNDIPKKACPWCGRNIGLKNVCNRCYCDLTKCAVISLIDTVEDKSDDDLNAYYMQAIEPMTAAVSLARLYRLKYQHALAIGAKPFLARKMNCTKYPPGVNIHKDYQMLKTDRSTSSEVLNAFHIFSSIKFYFLLIIIVVIINLLMR